MEQCPQGDMRDDIKRMGQEVSLGEASAEAGDISVQPFSFGAEERESISHFLSGWVNAKKFYGRNFPSQEAWN